MRLQRYPAIGCLLAAAVSCRDPRPTTGSLLVNVAGLPSGVTPVITVSGPVDFTRRVQSTTTLENLPPGDYLVSIATVQSAVALYAAAHEAERHHVSAGHTEVVNVEYSLASGSVNVIVTGLPDGLAPSLLFKSATTQRRVSGPGLVNAIPVGTYIVSGDTLSNFNDDRFAPAPATREVVVAPSLTPVDVTVPYTLASGSLAITVSGLPDILAEAPITVTGPNGFRRFVAGSTQLNGLGTGTYSVSAVQVNDACPSVFTPAQAQQSVAVAVGNVAATAVSYLRTQALSSNLNLRIDGMYVVQAVQDYAGRVPIVAGKPALVRVFGVANQCNSARPAVRVSLSTGDVYTIAAPDTLVPTAPGESSLAASWNVEIPAASLQPGVTISAVIDPTNAVQETNEDDNRYPAAGALPLDVRVIAPVPVRFVPVVIGGVAGNVYPARTDSLLALAKRMHPVSSYVADVRAVPYTSTHAPLTRDDEAGWGSVLAELNALRVADSSARYYHGIVHVTYSSGIAGIAYIGGRAGLSWDYLPSGAEVVAHELGHNFGRAHSPCGGPSGVDASYPSTGSYSGGRIGQFGYDFATHVLLSREVFTDVMGYCNNKWISDYTYTGMLEYLSMHPVPLTANASASVQPSLLVWGRIENGQPVLEPAFELVTRPVLPETSGPYTLTVLDSTGAAIVSLPFAAERIADLSGDRRTFAFAIPLAALGARAPASLRLAAQGTSVTNARSADVATDAHAVATRVRDRVARVRWDAAAFPAMMIRDAETGAVLSFARGGDATVATSEGAALELVYSNRVRSGRVVKRFR